MFPMKMMIMSHKDMAAIGDDSTASNRLTEKYLHCVTEDQVL